MPVNSVDCLVFAHTNKETDIISIMIKKFILESMDYLQHKKTTRVSDGFLSDGLGT